MMRSEQSTTGNISALVELFFDYNITELRSNQKNSTIISGSLEKQTVPQDWNVPTYGHLFQSWMEMVIYGGALVSRSLLKINKYMYGIYWLPLVHESSRLDSGVTLQTGLPLSLWEYWNCFSFFFFVACSNEWYCLKLWNRFVLRIFSTVRSAGCNVTMFVS